jgi:TPR repeat protein
MRAIGDLAYAQCKGTLLHNVTRYVLAKDGELALKRNGLLEEKLQEYDRSSLISDEACLANGRMAYRMRDFHRARKWYQLIDHKDISASMARELSKGCLHVAVAFGLEHLTYVIPLLKKIINLNASQEFVAEAAGRLGEIYYRQNDHEKSLKCMQKSAEGGSIKAMCNLGTHYRKNGNIKEALKWHCAAANEGALPGMINLFVDLAIESKQHDIEKSKLCDYADELILVMNKGDVSNEAEDYVLNVFPEQAPEGYKMALRMIKQYASRPMLSKFS